jgi:hypothetical protein
VSGETLSSRGGLVRRGKRASRIGAAGAVFVALVGAAGGDDADFAVRWRSVGEPAAREGTLLALSAEGGVFRAKDGGEQTIPRRDLWWIECTGPAAGDPHPAPAEHRATLTNGDRLLGTVTSLRDDVLSLRRPGGDVVDVPLESLDSVVLSRNAGLLLERTLWGQRTAADVLVLDNSDRLTGELIDLAGGRCRIRTAVGETAVDIARVSAVALNDELTATSRPPMQYVVLVLRDGSRITAAEVELRDGRLHAAGTAGFTVSLDPAEVLRMDCYGGRVRSLTASEPVEVEFTPYLNRGSEHQVDRNVRKGPLVLDGLPAGTGLGVSTTSRLSYALEDEAQTFHATIGLDDEAGSRGSAVFVVLGDGRELFRSPILRRSDAAVEVGPLPLTGVRRLTLSAEFGDGGDVQDVVDWVRPSLLR